MDDKTPHTSAWLAFSLAFDASARHCDYLRQEGYLPAQIGQLIADYRAGVAPSQGRTLASALAQEPVSEKLLVLRSENLQKRICAALDWAQSDVNHHLLGLDHPIYPTTLLDTDNPPPLLYAKGDLTSFNCPAVAIVGSRKASRQAIDLSFTLAASLARCGIAVVSGLARGIDAAAHEGALSVGGKTIAVAATAPESVYPKRHAGLERRIIEQGGLVITEYPLGSPTLRWYFPRRNRIISGLSRGVLVAEAGLPSGTLTTAAHAADQGREVMAIPGSVLNPLAKGCHALIKQGAALVECEQDILDVLNLPSLCQTKATGVAKSASQSNIEQQSDLAFTPEDALETLILSALAPAPASIDELMTHMDCSVTQLSTRLGLMEIEGKVKTCSGGRYGRC